VHGLHGIITIEPGKRSGKPCIRGLRITVYDVLDYLASGMTEAENSRDSPAARIRTPRGAWPSPPTANANSRFSPLELLMDEISLRA